MIRGCKCAMSMKAARRFLPSLSSSAVLCRAVRAGQLSKRKKMTRIVVAMISATNVNAIGHATRCGFADFDIGRSTFGVERFCSYAIEQEQDREQEQEESGNVVPKKYRPPHPIGVKGGCSPQNNLRKLLKPLSEVSPAGNKILYKALKKFSGSSDIDSFTVNEDTTD